MSDEEKIRKLVREIESIKRAFEKYVETGSAKDHCRLSMEIAGAMFTASLYSDDEEAA